MSKKLTLNKERMTKEKARQNMIIRASIMDNLDQTYALEPVFTLPDAMIETLIWYIVQLAHAKFRESFNAKSAMEDKLSIAKECEAYVQGVRVTVQQAYKLHDLKEHNPFLIEHLQKSIHGSWMKDVKVSGDRELIQKLGF